jgi:protein ImuB
MPLAEAAALGPRGRATRRAAAAVSRPPTRRERPVKGSRDAASRDSLQLCEHQADEDLAALAKLAVWCEQFSPIVGLEESPPPAGLLLDVTGLGPLFGGERRLAELIVLAFRRLGYGVRVAVADTVGAAWALAHYGGAAAPRDDAESIGDEIVVAPPGQLREFLAPLPVAALRLTEETAGTLAQLGVLTIEQLCRLPRGGLATRLGKSLIQRMDQALGRQSEVIVAHRPPPEFAAERVLEHPLERRDALQTILSQLTEEVAAKLMRHDHAAVQVEGRLEGQTTLRRLQVGLFQPSSNPRHIEDLLRLQLEQLQMPEAVQRVRLAAVTTVRIRGEQQVLWEDAGQSIRRELAVLVDRLGSRLGKENVCGVQPRTGALPERAYREKPWADIMAARRWTPTDSAAPSAAGVAYRPLWLQEPPQPLAMVSVASTGNSGDGPPIFFHYQNTRHDVARHWGPERIETGWWRGRGVRRDYYRVETQTGQRFWLFRRLGDNAWFLHGCFV